MPVTVPEFSQMVIDARNEKSADGVKISPTEYQNLKAAWAELVDPKVHGWFERTVNGISRNFVIYAGGSLHKELLSSIIQGQDYATFAKKCDGYAGQVDQILAGN